MPKAEGRSPPPAADGDKRFCTFQLLPFAGTMPSRKQGNTMNTSLASIATVLVSLTGLLPALHAASAQSLPAPCQLATGWELQDAAKVPQTGEVISQVSYAPEKWYQAVVPGTVLTSLVKNGVYPDPLYGENNRPDKISDSLCRTTYWYRTPFTVPPSFAGKHVWLDFEGINYIAEVWVNSHRVGDIKGAFARGIFDVTPYVSVGGSNALAVHILPPPHPGETHEKTITTGTGPNGGVSAQDGPTFLCTIGWDWIPTIRDRDMGLWQSVTLWATGPVVLPDPYVKSDLQMPRMDSADLTIETTVRNVSDAPQSGVLSGAIDEITFQQPVSLAPNETRKVVLSPETTPVLRLKKPRLWWPNGFGPQNLYTLHLSFALNGAESDVQAVQFGIRKLAYTVPGNDNLAFTVNGVPVFAKGGNWGMDEAMKRIPRQRLEAQIRLHQLANYTIIRNWVGQSTSRDFYELCDHYGLLLWDEFFQPNPGDGPNAEDLELYLTNVREKLLRFRNHPSIALWCARNEGDPPPNIGQGIQKLINELDPVRLYQPSSTSGRGVISNGPYRWRLPREFYAFNNEAFKTEIGMISVPTLEAIRAMMPASDWEVINDDWAEHDFCAGAQAGDRYPGILTTRYGPLASQADFVRKAQLANYESFRAMYEGRFAKMFRPSTALITWMSNPTQPSFVWQLYSHDLEPNASLFAARKACEPVHIQMNQNDWHLMVINNSPELLKGAKVKVLVYNLDGSEGYSHASTLNAAPSAATDAGLIAFPAKLSAVHFVKLELRDAKKRLLSENFYWRATPDREDDFTALNNLPRVELKVQATRHYTQGKCLLDVSLRNPTDTVALMAHLQLRQANSGKRVLPVFYSDNYVSLLPRETRKLTIEAAAADLGIEPPVLVVDGWNVTAEPVYGVANTVAIAPNAEAQSRGTPPASGPTEFFNLNCGGPALGFYHFGSSLHGIFIRDFLFAQGGKTFKTNETVEAQGDKAAPAAVYQTARRGAFVYTLPVGKGLPCVVRLHFAEVELAPGARKFNVDINGQRVLTDFDIAAEAGSHKALVKEFPSISPDAAGNIVLKFSRGAVDEPTICGIQVLR
jgi:hypothetical protein